MRRQSISFLIYFVWGFQSNALPNIFLCTEKMNWEDAHNYCRSKDGFLPTDETPAIRNKFFSMDPFATHFWSSLHFSYGHYIWTSKYPKLKGDEVKILKVKDPWNKSCILWSRSNSFIEANCTSVGKCACITDDHEDSAFLASSDAQLEVTANNPPQSDWIEVPAAEFSKVMLNCSIKNKSVQQVLTITHWKRNGIWLDHHENTIQPSRFGNKMSSLPDLDANKQGTYCCEAWVANSAVTEKSNCILVTLSGFTTFIITAVAKVEREAINILTSFNQSVTLSSSLWFTNMSIAYIKTSKTETAYEHIFYFYVQNQPIMKMENIVQEISKFLQNIASLERESHANCSSTESFDVFLTKTPCPRDDPQPNLTTNSLPTSSPNPATNTPRNTSPNPSPKPSPNPSLRPPPNPTLRPPPNPSPNPPSCNDNCLNKRDALLEISNDIQGYGEEKYEQLSKLTEEPKALSASHLIDITYIMQNFTTNPNISEKLNYLDIFSTLSNLMGTNSSEWSVAQEQNGTSILVETFEKLSFVINAKSNVIVNHDTERLSVAYVPMADTKNVIGYQAGNYQAGPINTGGNIDLNFFEVYVTFPEYLMDKLKNNISTNLLFVAYKSTELFPDNGTSKVGSLIMQATFQNYNVCNLPEDQRIRIHFQPRFAANNENIHCVFWDYELKNKKGGWSKDGCTMVGQFNPNDVTCECTHLSSMTILMDSDASAPLEPIHKFSLDFISISGCALSVFGLVMVLATFIMFEEGRSKKNKIRTNLCLAILLSLVIFLSGSQQTGSYPLCLSVSISLHYLILVSFCWTIIESILIYYTILKQTQAGNIPINYFIQKATAFAWGMPAVIVFIVCSINYKIYENEKISEICWMSSTGFYYAFVSPVLLIFMVNVITYSVIISFLFIDGRNSYNANGPELRLHQTTSNNTRAKLPLNKIALSVQMFFLMGFTWIFGFLYFGTGSLTFAYLFCIFNSSQGLFLCYFHIYGNPKIRNLWYTFIRNGMSAPVRTYFSNSIFYSSSPSTDQDK